MKWNPPILLLALGVLAGAPACSDPSSSGGEEQPRWVRTAKVEPLEPRAVQLSGIVRARSESPLAFRVGGRIAERRVDAGQVVSGGQALLELDPRDLEQAARVARADLDAAVAELETARAETRRNRGLLEREFISDQVFERVQLAENSARERVDAARARLEQAENALDYATLDAPAAGTLIEVTAEPGQVVAAGQTVATLALDGAREIEVFLPAAYGEPRTGRIVRGADGQPALFLREIAGAADPLTRTWTARYVLAEPAPALRLGSIVRVALDIAADSPAVFEVPIGAINERGQGPQVWMIFDGRAEPVPVTLLDLDTESARITGELPADAEVIALGTHLLEAGMAVRPLGD